MLPIPVVKMRIESFARIRRPVQIKSVRRARNEGESRLVFNLPTGISVNGRLSLALSLHQKGGPVGELCQRRINAPVPHNGGNDVVSRVQRGGKIKGLVSPMRQVSSSWAFADANPVDEDNKAIVRTNIDKRNDQAFDRGAKSCGNEKPLVRAAELWDERSMPPSNRVAP